MWRGILSIVALLLIVGSLIIIVPIMIIPNTFLHQLVPVLKPLHQALACTDGETMEYEQVYVVDSYETHYRCVDAAGQVRDVDDVLLRPAYYSLGTLCLGGLLMLAPLFVAFRQVVNGNLGDDLQQSYNQMPSAMTTLNASGQEQLAALDKLRQQGLISQDAYTIAKQRIFDNFSSDRPS